MAANHGLLAHHFDSLEQQREAASLGMWAFLATEVLVFGAVLTGYVVFRIWYPADCEAVSSKLNVLIGAVNTVVLLTSSLTMALSVYAARAGQRRTLLWCLVLTAVLGTAFMVLKAFEYYGDYVDGLVPNADTFRPEEWTHNGEHPMGPERAKLFLMFYYIMTGLHAVHLTIGIGLILWLAVLAQRNVFSPEHYTPVEMCGLYWHFVDIVWIFLLPLLYLTGTQDIHHLHFMQGWVMAEHLVQPKTYYGVFAALIALTLLTVGISFLELGNWHTPIGLAIAVTKMLLVALFFMHLWHSSKLTWVAAGAGLFWLGILMVLTVSDYLSRAALGY